MTGFASRDKQPLSRIAIIDQTAINQITAGLDIAGAVSDYLIANPPSGGLTIDQIKADTSIADAITKKHTNISDHSNSNDHAPNSDNQDLSTLQPKETGKGLYPDADGTKLAGIEASANNYSHPSNHAPSVITQDVSNRFVTDAEKVTWNAAGSPFLAKLILGADKPTGANVTPVTLGLSFNYIANSQYVIDIYAIVAPTAATTGCGFMIDVSAAVTYVGTFVNHQLAITGTTSGAASIGDLAVTSSGVSSGMVSTASQFVYGGGILVTGANAGTATFFFRSETTAVTTCKVGTCIRVMKMN